MCVDLDRLFEPRVLAARAWRLRAETPLAGWLRLAALDSPAAGAGDVQAGRMVRVDVELHEGDGGVPVLVGDVAVTLRCVCQRCLEVMDLDLRAQPKLFFGHAEQLGEALAAAGYEPCELEPGATLRQLLEDEALLSMPAIPVHGRSEDCGALAAKLAELEPAPGGENTSSPFAVLAELMRKN